MQLGGNDLPRVLQEHRAAADDVDAGGQDAPVVLERLGQPVVGHRGVDRAVGLGRQHRVEVGGRRDARRIVKSGKLAASLPALASDDTQTPVSSNRESVISWVSAWLPTLPVPICGDANGHGVAPHRSGMGRSRFGKVRPPSTSSVLPVR